MEAILIRSTTCLVAAKIDLDRLTISLDKRELGLGGIRLTFFLFLHDNI